jgi:hypothetical protein
MISTRLAWMTPEAPTLEMKVVRTMLANQEVLSRIWTPGNLT